MTGWEVLAVALVWSAALFVQGYRAATRRKTRRDAHVASVRRQMSGGALRRYDQ